MSVNWKIEGEISVLLYVLIVTVDAEVGFS
jgi:hypothetical protein